MNNYIFRILYDNKWVVHINDDRRLMGQGNPYTDEHFTQFLDDINRGELSGVLKGLIHEYRICGDPVVLDANKGGFKFVKGDVAHLTDRITYLLRKLVDSYCV